MDGDAVLELLRRQADALERLADAAETAVEPPEPRPWRPDRWYHG